MTRNEQTYASPKARIELLAPAGSLDAGYAAFHYGADAVFLGLSDFSARAAAKNFTIEEMANLAGYAHSLPKRRKVYVALNTLIRQDELGAAIDLLAAVADAGADTVIVQDLGMLAIIRRHFPRLKAHASTQMAVHNRYGVETAIRMGMARVTLARELTLEEIAGIAATPGIETEVFVHGALCYSYSGLCLFSSHVLGRSGNRGKCAYPCRELFTPQATESGNSMIAEKGGLIFSMKDLALPHYIAKLERAGVTALKIEGRMKSPLYVAAAVNYYRLLIDNKINPEKQKQLAADLQTIFSRPLTDLYLRKRQSHDVVDTETTGHRGFPVGKVEKIVPSASSHLLCFRTALPLELHDGLQIEVAGEPRPFGFAVSNIQIVDAKGSINTKRVFEAPAFSNVEIPMPPDHPHIPKGAVIYCASSQRVKRQYRFFTPKQGEFLPRKTADLDIKIGEQGFDVTAASEIDSLIQGEKVRLEAVRHCEGAFERARDITRVSAAITKCFQKLGTTRLVAGEITIHNPMNLALPLSQLNAARRETILALENEISDYINGRIGGIKAAILPRDFSSGRGNKAVGPGNRDFKWSLKTDQPDLLAAFAAKDTDRPDEIIVECARDPARNLPRHIEMLSSIFGKEHIRLSLPPIMRKWEMQPLEKTVPYLISTGWRKWQIANLGGLAFLNAVTPDGGPLDISADWQIYVTNRAAVQQLNSLGIRRFTLSPEDGLENMRGLLNEFAEDATVIVYQDTPLMISETCVFASGKCHGPGTCKFKEAISTSAHGDKIRVVNRGCRMAVLNFAPFCLAEHLDELAQAGALNLRVDFIHRQYSQAEAFDIWLQVRSGSAIAPGHIANFRRGLG